MKAIERENKNKEENDAQSDFAGRGKRVDCEWRKFQQSFCINAKYNE